MPGWLRRWQERRITRAWLRETAGDRRILEGHFDCGDGGDGVTVMRPKRGGGKGER
jgi:hypothetical protein